jgi:hypothetical protein
MNGFYDTPSGNLIYMFTRRDNFEAIFRKAAEMKAAERLHRMFVAVHAIDDIKPLPVGTRPPSGSGFESAGHPSPATIDVRKCQQYLCPFLPLFNESFNATLGLFTFSVWIGIT